MLSWLPQGSIILVLRDTRMLRCLTRATSQSIQSFDRVAETVAALVIVALAVFLLIRNQPIADRPDGARYLAGRRYSAAR